MNKTKVFETERLILRPFKSSDAEDMFKNYTNNENVCKYLTWRPHGKLENTIGYLQNVVLPRYEKENELIWAIELKETGEVIGNFDVNTWKENLSKMTIGYVLSEDYWGQGITKDMHLKY